jgi:hypothetical protein
VPGADDRRRTARRDQLLAGAVALGLGGLAAVMMVAGHAPWEGPQVLSVTQDHGLHAGDVLALAPLLAGLGLARWCVGRP